MSAQYDVRVMCFLYNSRVYCDARHYMYTDLVVVDRCMMMIGCSNVLQSKQTVCC